MYVQIGNLLSNSALYHTLPTPSYCSLNSLCTRLCTSLITLLYFSWTLLSMLYWETSSPSKWHLNGTPLTFVDVFPVFSPWHSLPTECTRSRSSIHIGRRIRLPCWEQSCKVYKSFNLHQCETGENISICVSTTKARHALDRFKDRCLAFLCPLPLVHLATMGQKME